MIVWNRAQLKQYAKLELRQSYWTGLGVCIVAGLLGSGGAGRTFQFFQLRRNARNSGGNSGHTVTYSAPLLFIGAASLLSAFLWGILYAALISTAMLSLYSIFVGGPASIGVAHFFMNAPFGDRRFGNLFNGFRNGRYIHSVGIMFKTGLFIFLWSLLFIVPGIIKSYQYRLVPYIAAENPRLSANECMQLSRRMTEGHKLEMFVLDLSFLGWYLLGTLAFGIGILFVHPYVEATWAQLYLALRLEAPPSAWLMQPGPQAYPQQAGWQG